MRIHRKPGGPLAPGSLRCFYCVDDYLTWMRDPAAREAPEVGQALTVLPSAGSEPGAGAAVCLVHLRALMRYRRPDRKPPAAERDPEDRPREPSSVGITRLTPRIASG